MTDLAKKMGVYNVLTNLINTINADIKDKQKDIKMAVKKRKECMESIKAHPHTDTTSELIKEAEALITEFDLLAKATQQKLGEKEMFV